MSLVPFFRFLGLAQRAGKAISGEDTVLRSIKKQKVYLVIMASDASSNTEKLFRDKCRSYHIPLSVVRGSREELGRAVGKDKRVVVGITDKGFVKKLIQLSDQ